MADKPMATKHMPINNAPMQRLHGNNRFTTGAPPVMHPLRGFAGLLLLGCAMQATAGWASEVQNPSACVNPDARDGGDLVYCVRAYGEDRPADREDTPAAWQRNRRVEVSHQQIARGTATSVAEGSARVTAQMSIQLPGGGLVWATEDPSTLTPVLNVQAPSLVAYDDGRISQAVRFQGYNNYASFIERIEITLYRGSDSDQVSPLARIQMPVAHVASAEWDGILTAATNLRVGDELLYVARAYDAQGNFDETAPRYMQLVTPADYQRGQQMSQDQLQRAKGLSMDAGSASDQQVSDAIYGNNGLRLQNIPVYGSRVRLQGRDIPFGTGLSINGKSFPVDQEGKFAAEFLEPVGPHQYQVAVSDQQQVALQRMLQVDVSGRYALLMALADVTVSQNSVSGDISPQAGDPGYDDDFLTEGRLAFFMKGKWRGKYLFTAQADTRQDEFDHLFDGFFDADPQDIFRRLDPDLYYPVYGDDSTTWREVDTQGKLYLRVDWDQNQALWGNFATGFSGTEYGQYNRSLYGGALSWRSRAATALGDPRSLLKLFASQAQTALGHSELLGTGGSLYYLRHTDVLPGSDQVVLEIRDLTTGRTESRATLQRGVDYEIDEMQGRLILTRPLAQLTRENVRTLTRDTPLDGYEQRLLVDYEYVPVGFDSDDVSVGLRGRQWLGDHVAIGGTYIDENRGGDDYQLMGADLTLQAGRGTYLKLESNDSEATAAPIFYSDNGGLSFSRINPIIGNRSGQAQAVEARANLKQLGWTEQDWSLGSWWRQVDAGFSVARQDTGQNIEEYGGEVLGYFNEDISLYGRYSQSERGSNSLQQTQLTADWRLGQDTRLGAELRNVSEQRSSGTTDATLAALSYRYRLDDRWELYGSGQYTLDDDSGRYDDNNLLTLGARHMFGDKSSIGAEASSGSRGQGYRLDSEFRISPNQTVYGAYNFSTDSTERDPLFNTALQSGWTLGQRWRINNQVNVYNESQYLKDTRGGSDGLAHTFGLDFTPAPGWNLGFTLMDGEVLGRDGQVDRRAYSINGGRTHPRAQWASKLEYRQDSGAEQRDQWVTSNRVMYKVNEDLRLALRGNYARTEDKLNPLADARLAETNLGFAWRPHDNTRWALFGKYTWLLDLASLGQEGGNQYDQRSQVLALEGVQQLNDRWEIGGKLASRRGDYRTGRGSGQWLDSDVDFSAVQLRYHLVFKWEALAEYRWLRVKDGGDRRGWLLGVDRQIADNFKVGAGYNFTEFSDDLTDLEYDHKGWFVNVSGFY